MNRGTPVFVLGELRLVILQFFYERIVLKRINVRLILYQAKVVDLIEWLKVGQLVVVRDGPLGTWTRCRRIALRFWLKIANLQRHLPSFFIFLFLFFFVWANLRLEILRRLLLKLRLLLQWRLRRLLLRERILGDRWALIHLCMHASILLFHLHFKSLLQSHRLVQVGEVGAPELRGTVLWNRIRLL